MTPAPLLKGKERALERAGFRVDRSRGSHVFMKHPDGRATAIPTHSGEIIGPGLFRSILRDIEITLDGFLKLL